MKKYLFFVLFLLAFQPLAANAGSVDWTTLNPDLSDATFVKSSEKCLECHEDQMAVHEKTAHGKAFKYNPKTGTDGFDCENCHGPMSKHLDAPKKRPALVVSFKKESGVTAEKLTAVCLQCHEKGGRMQWNGGAHALNDLSCASCHSMHSSSHSVDVKRCYSCHPKTRAEFQRSSHLPVREGQMSCSSCHDPHGSKGPTLLKDASINDTCYGCHADKRGPFLWEHAPVRENCINCHEPHGSNHANLLRMKAPYLCQQQCHTPRQHPTEAYSGSNIIGGSTPRNVALGKSCLNCHSQVHGSNHPSGAVLQR